AALQAYFTARVQRLVAHHHKIMEGWDEVLQPGTPKNVVIQSWRGQKSLAQAARQGNRGLLSTGYYLDLNQPASQHYMVDPLGGDAATLTPEEKSRILGGEAAEWTEFASAENIDIRIWPRTAAIAERLWSPQQVRDVDSMYRRLAVVTRKLEAYGLNARATTDVMLQRMSGNPDPVALRVLATAVQPPLGYDRSGRDVATVFTPLNRLADAVPAESVRAREFHDVASTIAGGKGTPQQWQQARKWLTKWRDNDAKLRPSLDDSSLTKELIPVSQRLRDTATIGLAALDALHSNDTMASDVRQHDMEALKSAEKQEATLMNVVAPSVELLVQAVRTQ
ncbi:MAG: family 20 glycosylhydrolase, partial [Acidobacteriaceae bacterium]